MLAKRNSPLLVAAVALLFVVVAVAAGWRVVNGDNSLLRNVSVDKKEITPNADGQDDATLVQYELSRNATVSIYFEDEAGERYYFREEKSRGAGEYRVLFSGVVDGYPLPGDTIQGEILSRLLQDGVYTWTVAATDEAGASESIRGQLTIAAADTELPEIRNFTLDTRTFSPNQDGIADRVKPQFYLTKEVTDLRVFLLVDGQEVPITELERDVPARMPGYHIYDYDGGVEQGAPPPPDGTYPLIAEAQDLEGQKVRVEDRLAIEYGGVPLADVFSPPTADTLRFESTAVALCDTIWFEITVRNYGQTPIRTTGPPPGTVYDSDWNYNTLGWGTESGAFRVGIGYENELKDYPYRWAIGNLEDLEEIDGHYYLMPGERAVVTGGIRVVDVFGV
ncbi:MAG TPA: hypothetical protein VF177_16915, partial [Anaerolineae bacterium]